MFVSAEDFDLVPYNIPDLEDSNSFAPYVAKKEKDILSKKLLGRSLYNSFVSGIGILPAEWDDATTYAIDAQVVSGNDVLKSLQNGNTNHSAIDDGVWWEYVEQGNKWLLLKNGDTYLYQNKMYEWVGMKELLIPVVFAYWMRDNFDTYTQTGVSTGKSENADKELINRRVIEANNDYATIAGYRRSRIDTLYGYLYNKGSEGTTFDNTFDISFTSFRSYFDYVFKAPKKMNLFGLNQVSR